MKNDTTEIDKIVAEIEEELEYGDLQVVEVLEGAEITYGIKVLELAKILVERDVLDQEIYDDLLQDL